MARRTETDPRASVQRAIEAASQTTRRGEHPAPLGPKAIQTRLALMEAAFRRFTADGYASTTVADIAEEAGVSLGTYYQYFRDRADVIAALAANAAEAMLQDTESAWRVEDGREGLHAMLRGYVKAYAITAKFQAAWEEVTHVDEGLAFLRRELGRAVTATVEEQLRRGQERGIVRESLEPAGAALALTAMVDRTCYLRFVLDRPRRSRLVDDTADTLTDLWWSSIAAPA